MKQTILYYDCFSGISGDMNLAALIGLGVPQEHVVAELGKLGLDGWKLRVSPDSKKGIHGLRVDVDLTVLRPKSLLRGGESGHSGTHKGSHDHRAWKDIRHMIVTSSLSEGTKNRALAMFGVLAAAEAKVHGTTPDEVHFHEVGAVDSIVDTIGAAICLEWLKPDVIMASTVELGGGFVKCQHGLIPVPAPAVVEVLTGKPVKSGAADKETTTPTGAAILAASVQEWQDKKQFSILKTAYGVGHRDLDIPNLLRVFWAERDRADAEATGAHTACAGTHRGQAVILDCNIDDMSPESHSHLFDVFFGAGASDLWITPIVMKKSRSAVCLSVLCEQKQQEAMTLLLLKETSTLGVRSRMVDKTMLGREIKEFETTLGRVRVKYGILGGVAIKSKMEYEDLHRIALQEGLSLDATRALLGREIDFMTGGKA